MLGQFLNCLKRKIASKCLSIDDDENREFLAPAFLFDAGYFGG
jgi:hypothetical protein